MSKEHTPTATLPASFVDDRGIIKNILHEPINSVAIIESKAGSVRSNHWHKTDSHYLYVISGQADYSERNLDGSGVFHKSYMPGEMFYTLTKKVHRVSFPVDTVLLSLAKNVRDHEHHEQDVVREDF